MYLNENRKSPSKSKCTQRKKGGLLSSGGPRVDILNVAGCVGEHPPRLGRVRDRVTVGNKFRNFCIMVYLRDAGLMNPNYGRAVLYLDFRVFASEFP